MKFQMVNGTLSEVVEIQSPELQSDIAWWDFTSKLDLYLDNKFESIKLHIKENIHEWFIDILGEVADLMTSVALFGGGMLLVLRVAGGIERAGKWFFVIQIVNVTMKYIIGGL